MTHHYPLETLELYRHGKMSLLGRIVCSAHLKKCPECREKLNELATDDRFLDNLRQSMRSYGNIAGVAVGSSKNATSDDPADWDV
ncbi:MAG: hypothetical protein MJ016_07015 [Victivallaceae bacterium]|nr:hypothetical protein [Victivallaceae bacterium]